MGKPRFYKFPENQRAKRCDLGEQLRKIREEVDEVIEAYESGESYARVLEELGDVYQAVEGAWRKFPLLAVLLSLILVSVKSKKRGDYGRDEDGR
jgi:hypothetical protein